MELVGYSECYSPCLRPLGMRVTVVAMLIQIHQTLKTLELRRKCKALGWLAGVGLEESPVPHCLFTPLLGSRHCAGTEVMLGFNTSMTFQLSLWMPQSQGTRHHGLLLLCLLNAKAVMATE